MRSLLLKTLPVLATACGCLAVCPVGKTCYLASVKVVPLSVRINRDVNRGPYSTGLV